MSSYFSLLDSPQSASSAMEEIQKRIEAKPEEESDKMSVLDILEKIYIEVKSLDNKRTRKVLREEAKPSMKKAPSWTSKEIQTLIRGVFRYGENEW